MTAGTGASQNTPATTVTTAICPTVRLGASRCRPGLPVGRTHGPPRPFRMYSPTFIPLPPPCGCPAPFPAMFTTYHIPGPKTARKGRLSARFAAPGKRPTVCAVPKILRGEKQLGEWRIIHTLRARTGREFADLNS